jgi:hypothetical protein
VTKFEGLEQHEVVCLATIAENLDHPEDHASAYLIKRDMEASGFTKIASTLALAGLLKKDLLSLARSQDFTTGEYYSAYKLTESGWAWMLANKEKFVLRRPKDDDIPPSGGGTPPSDDDIPSF